ncbi:NADAR family protein [Nonomuraea muscovyensis]|uniref:NADAR family protein n=1 Tax=Nonomuraea muscovyensis TaxID=1124761 RepID=UPI0033E3A64E
MSLPRTVAAAVAAEHAGRPPSYLHFWGHRPNRDGGVGRGCLSQWWPADFTEDGRLFRSAEHYMMTHKALLFGDEETAAAILAVSHPGEAKKLGRLVRGFDEATWAEHRYGIVVRAGVAKFAAHPELRDYLLGTEKHVLVEASPLDRVWGIGLAADDPAATSAATWKGLNLLGFALMDARDELSAH